MWSCRTPYGSVRRDQEETQSPFPSFLVPFPVPCPCISLLCRCAYVHFPPPFSLAPRHPPVPAAHVPPDSDALHGVLAFYAYFGLCSSSLHQRAYLHPSSTFPTLHVMPPSPSLQLMFPSLLPLWQLLATFLPDTKQSQNMAVRSKVVEISRILMRQWQDSKAAAAAAATANGNGNGDGEAGSGGDGVARVSLSGAGDGKAPAGAAAAGGSGAAAAFRQVGGGISSSSFMAAMLEGRRGASREDRLSDLEVRGVGDRGWGGVGWGGGKDVTRTNGRLDILQASTIPPWCGVAGPPSCAEAFAPRLVDLPDW